jgi:hypothetical protein
MVVQFGEASDTDCEVPNQYRSNLLLKNWLAPLFQLEKECVLVRGA